MEKIKLLIADSDVRFSEQVCAFLKNFPDIQVSDCKQDGNDALRIIRNTRPDAVLFDLVLPGLDGISLLRNVSSMPNPPAMICCTRFYSDVALEAMRTFGASYLLFKPMELHALHPAIVSCAELHRKLRRFSSAMHSEQQEDMHYNGLIRNYIVSLGIPSKLIGCSYLAEAVRLAREDPSLVRNLSKGLYLEISRNMNTTPSRIERCIRNAISIAYQSGGLNGKMITCPSNKEFINFILRTIDI